MRLKFKLAMTQFHALQAMVAANTLSFKQSSKPSSTSASYTEIPAKQFSLEKFCIWLMHNIRTFHKFGKDRFNLPSVGHTARERLIEDEFKSQMGGEVQIGNNSQNSSRFKSPETQWNQ